MNIDFKLHDSKILKDVKIITPSIFDENRGSIWTSFKEDKLNLITRFISAGTSIETQLPSNWVLFSIGFNF